MKQQFDSNGQIWEEKNWAAHLYFWCASAFLVLPHTNRGSNSNSKISQSQCVHFVHGYASQRRNFELSHKIINVLFHIAKIKSITSTCTAIFRKAGLPIFQKRKEVFRISSPFSPTLADAFIRSCQYKLGFSHIGPNSVVEIISLSERWFFSLKLLPNSTSWELECFLYCCWHLLSNILEETFKIKIRLFWSLKFVYTTGW